MMRVINNSKKAKRLVFIFIAQLFTLFSFSQNCDSINRKSGWEKVEIREMYEKHINIDGYRMHGEWIIKTQNNINSLEDLTIDEIKEIKTFVAKHKGCIVYLDINKYWGDLPGGIYMYWFGKSK